MWDWLRRWLQSAETRRLEAISAYVDDALAPPVRRRFEAAMARDDALRADVARLRQLKAGLRQLPRPESPRNFTLDPARYGRPARAPGVRLYPAFRLATALAGLLFMLALVLTLLPQPTAQQVASLESPAAAPTPEAAQEAADTLSEEARIAPPNNESAEALPPEAPGESTPGGFSISAAQPTPPLEATPTPAPTSTPLPGPEPAVSTSPMPHLLGLGGVFGVLLIVTFLLRRRLSL